MARGEYTTRWDYRRGYIATTSPVVAGLIGIGAACVGVAALICAVQGVREDLALQVDPRWALKG
jgi:hypothetical protein